MLKIKDRGQISPNYHLESGKSRSNHAVNKKNKLAVFENCSTSGSQMSVTNPSFKGNDRKKWEREREERTEQEFGYKSDDIVL